MRGVSFLLSLFAVVALLMLGAGGVSASAEIAPCHEMARGHDMGAVADGPSPNDSPSPAKAMKTMGCCVACVAAPVFPPPLASALRATPGAMAPVPYAIPSGWPTTPEPGPPRA